MNKDSLNRAISEIDETLLTDTVPLVSGEKRPSNPWLVRIPAIAAAAAAVAVGVILLPKMGGGLPVEPASDPVAVSTTATATATTTVPEEKTTEPTTAPTTAPTTEKTTDTKKTTTTAPSAQKTTVTTAKTTAPTTATTKVATTTTKRPTTTTKQPTTTTRKKSTRYGWYYGMRVPFPVEEYDTISEDALMKYTLTKYGDEVGSPEDYETYVRDEASKRFTILPEYPATNQQKIRVNFVGHDWLLPFARRENYGYIWVYEATDSKGTMTCGIVRENSSDRLLIKYLCYIPFKEEQKQTYEAYGVMDAVNTYFLNADKDMPRGIHVRVELNSGTVGVSLRTYRQDWKDSWSLHGNKTVLISEEEWNKLLADGARPDNPKGTFDDLITPDAPETPAVFFAGTVGFGYYRGTRNQIAVRSLDGVQTLTFISFDYCGYSQEDEQWALNPERPGSAPGIAKYNQRIYKGDITEFPYLIADFQ